jgi:hypothetical protein
MLIQGGDTMLIQVRFSELTSRQKDREDEYYRAVDVLRKAGFEDATFHGVVVGPHDTEPGFISLKGFKTK